jgi:hypothetical protein
MTTGFGGKWKQFFQDLELDHGLNVGLNAHIWLLHHLFLPEINEDAQLWVGAWNNHPIHIRGQQLHSPREIYYFEILQNGSQGTTLKMDNDLGNDAEDVDLAGYGVDWDELNDVQICRHHDAENNEDLCDIEDNIPYNPFLPQAPNHFTIVEVDEVNSPLTPEQIQYLDAQLTFRVPTHSRSIEAYHLRWDTALQLCMHMYFVQ